MSFLDVFRSPGRRLTHDESADIARRRGLIERESLPDRLKRLRREAETDRQEKEKLEALRLLPTVLEKMEEAAASGWAWWYFMGDYEQNHALAELLKARGLKVKRSDHRAWYYMVKLPR